MKRIFIFSTTLFLLAVIHTSCIGEFGDVMPPIMEYYKPVYANAQELYQVSTMPSRPLHDPGRIYLKGSLLIINERYKGFHLIDNSDPANPKPLMFLKVQGAVNMAMQDQYLYADNITDLVTIDLSNLQQIREVNRQKDVFEGNQKYPPFRNVNFECVDPKRGIVVGWELADAPKGKPECWR